jgi:tRNA nucleotidyltransferase (CCA-adding enzyme)
MMDLGNKTAMKSQKRCQTLPPNDYQESLYQKISEYNTCLMARTYRFQEKDRERIAVRLNETERSEQTQRGSPLATSKIRRCENFKKNNRWVHSKGKFLQTSPISSEQVEFQPW